MFLGIVPAEEVEGKRSRNACGAGVPVGSGGLRRVPMMCSVTEVERAVMYWLLQDNSLTLCEPTHVCLGTSRNVFDKRADDENAT